MSSKVKCMSANVKEMAPACRTIAAAMDGLRADTFSGGSNASTPHPGDAGWLARHLYLILGDN